MIGSLPGTDVVEAPAKVSPAGLEPVPVPDLPGPARALVEQVKEYERATVQAARTGDAELAAVALALHPLVPGTTVARELLADYREQHGETLAYTQLARPAARGCAGYPRGGRSLRPYHLGTWRHEAPVPG